MHVLAFSRIPPPRGKLSDYEPCALPVLIKQFPLIMISSTLLISITKGQNCPPESGKVSSLWRWHMVAQISWNTISSPCLFCMTTALWRIRAIPEKSSVSWKEHTNKPTRKFELRGVILNRPLSYRKCWCRSQIPVGNSDSNWYLLMLINGNCI